MRPSTKQGGYRNKTASQMVGKIRLSKTPSTTVLSMLFYMELQTRPKVLLTFTGLTQAEFETLLPAFANVWRQYRHQQQAQTERRRTAGGGRKAVLNTGADRLLFILFYLKTYPLQEVESISSA